MGYRYCVFGAGRQGVAAIYDLVKFCDADLVIVYDPDTKAMDSAIKRLEDLLGDDYSKVLWISTLDERRTALINWKSFDVMISCAPWKANLELTEFAVRWSTPFCDLGGNPETVARQEKVITDTAIVPDCGLSPGISNILAVHLAREGCDEIRVRCGGIPILDAASIRRRECNPGRNEFGNELNYRLTFDPMGLISEYSGRVPVIINSRMGFVPALSEVRSYRDVYECSPTSNNSPQAIRTLYDLGVQNYDYMTIRYKGHWGLVLGWIAAGFLSGDADANRKLAETLENNTALKHDPNIHGDKVILSVVGRRGGFRLREVQGFDFDVYADPTTKFSAMERMTSWGITMVAHYIAIHNRPTIDWNDNLPPRGFATPERFVPGKWILDEIQRREGSPS